MNKLIKFILKSVVNGSHTTLLAIFLSAIWYVAHAEIIGTLKWFISSQLRLVLSDKTITTALCSFIISLFLYRNKK